MIDGQPVFLCCEGCRESLLKDPSAHLERLREYRENGGTSEDAADDQGMPLPPIGDIQAASSEDSFPAIGQIESPATAVVEPDTVQVQSASTDSDSGRIQQ
jgi:hypothetical protein